MNVNRARLVNVRFRHLVSTVCAAASIWNMGIIPTDWRRGIVVPIWKGKGDTEECNNYRGVTLLSVPGKVLARILLERVRQKLLTHQRHEQPGFTPKKSTVDRILALRVLTKRLSEQKSLVQTTSRDARLAQFVFLT